MLIDFGAAEVLPSPPIPYESGFLCCPPRILSTNTQPYTPIKADDYHAFVLVFNALLHPRSMKSFLSRMVNTPNSVESKCLQHLWLELTDSDTWGRPLEFKPESTAGDEESDSTQLGAATLDVDEAQHCGAAKDGQGG
ncbi:hypothetical protein FN846DRAFT_913882 [Sphaerosporella brunnea]|uniref:Uncharacterized protein n=1 Tax=Sphaerosporella brunnea TaxID=1250544 RepID=A0A5J5EFQ1_9PEZI|nr:hypothetical protein FN846DRAFT_913882 [Sphaerosporella brunnea]